MAPPEVQNDLNQTIAVCSAASESISSLAYGSNPNRSEPSSISTIRTDFLSLLALTRAHSTTLSLAFKPPPNYETTFRPLADLRDDVYRLAGCVQILAASQQGRTIYLHMRAQAGMIIDSVQSLAQAFLSTNLDDPEVAKKDKTYLLRMGSLHSAVDQCKAGMPADNLAAVLSKWRGNGETIKDALIEYEELAQSHEGGGGDEGEADEMDDFDDWNDVLGHDAPKKLTVEEAQVAKKCWMLARMVHALHTRISKYHFPSLSSPPTSSIPPSTSPSPSESLDTLLDTSNSIVEAIDDLTVSLYGPQKPESISEALGELRSATADLRKTLFSAIGVSEDELEGQMSGMSLENGDGNGADAEKRKNVQWLRTAFAQIETSIAGIP